MCVGSSPHLECGGSFTLLAPIFEGSFEGPPLLRLYALPANRHPERSGPILSSAP
jgi:hypothetical protein